MVAALDSAVSLPPAVRRGLMRVNPGYFDLSPVEQERYRANLSEQHRFLIQKQVYADLFGIECATQEELDKAGDDLRGRDTNRVNAQMLHAHGIGDDLIWLNEYLGDKTLLDFETLHDYDHSDYQFQEKARLKDCPDYTPRPYRGSLYGTWARLMIEGQMIYTTLYCGAGYLLGEIDQYSGDVLEQLIPHRLVPSPDHGKPEGRGSLWDYRIEADGREEQFEELRHRSWQYQQDRYEVLLDIWHREARGQVWEIDTSDKFEQSRIFVFSDISALKAVRFRRFLRDCKTLRGNPDVLDAALAEERERLESHLREQLADIDANFDPKVKKLRRKRKIVMAPGALDDLAKISEDEDQSDG